jgi:hypothetical protein
MQNPSITQAAATHPTPVFADRLGFHRRTKPQSTAPSTGQNENSWNLKLAKELRSLTTPGPKQPSEALNQRIKEMLNAANFPQRWAADKAALQHTQRTAVSQAKSPCAKLRAWYQSPTDKAAVHNASNYAGSTVAVLVDLYKKGELSAPTNAAAVVSDLKGVILGLVAGVPKKAAAPNQAADWAVGALTMLPGLMVNLAPLAALVI